MSRIYNFSAGPSMLPEVVLKKAAEEMMDYNGSGMSVMEMSHRSPVYDKIIKDAEASLRKLMSIPDNYKVLFVQGGATLQFSAVPLNLMKSGKADYIVSGQFSGKAAKEAERYGKVNVVGSTKDIAYARIPVIDESKFDPEADYLHFTTNNTIFGTHFNQVPKTKAPLVTDMSSSILSRRYNVNDYALIYAGAQKNLGPAGLTVVIIRDDMLERTPMEFTPTMLKYKTMADNDSMYNTPPTYGIYIAMLVFEWIKELGGVDAIEKLNNEKAALLYDYLDSQSYYTAPVEKDSRSMMNVTFVTGDQDLDKKFVSEAAKAGIVNIAGHRIVGGMRASIYNAMPKAGVEALVSFMDDFAKKNPK